MYVHIAFRNLKGISKFNYFSLWYEELGTRLPPQALNLKKSFKPFIKHEGSMNFNKKIPLQVSLNFTLACRSNQDRKRVDLPGCECQKAKVVVGYKLTLPCALCMMIVSYTQAIATFFGGRQVNLYGRCPKKNDQQPKRSAKENTTSDMISRKNKLRS